ncbi:MAG: NADP-dependent phosphogluconate dehydrogenase, partial [Anaerolineaceae bacterium]|nr:NADP-dependent phosphogluconate dehydrogenase [Anaerolineaceae bacterium]
RAIMMMVPAGSPVDAVIHDLLPFLNINDLIIDGGNSYYKDTELRQKTLQEKGVLFLGVGISGGEHGARSGASLMPGGPIDGYLRVEPILTSVAARVNGEACITYMGAGASGHYVKMVHNGIEYGLMELIAESYDLMKRVLHMQDDEIQQEFTQWNQTEINSYLLEITANIFSFIDPQTKLRLVDVILDEARQKGTGKWMSQDAMDLAVPVPTIDAAVSSRDLSAYKTEREQANRVLDETPPALDIERPAFLERLRGALYAGMLLTYGQGMSQLYVASKQYGYHLDLGAIASIWRGGCIIRAALLEKIHMAYHANPGLPNLLLDPAIGIDSVKPRIPDLREITKIGITVGIPLPAFAASLAYYDGYRSAWLPANLTQAQRDYFGAHTYERIDERGIFHTQWEEE